MSTRGLDIRKALTTEQAAERLQVSVSRVRQFLLQGRLRGLKFGTPWAIDPDDLAEFAKLERRTGNPNFSRTGSD